MMKWHSRLYTFVSATEPNEVRPSSAQVALKGSGYDEGRGGLGQSCVLLRQPAVCLFGHLGRCLWLKIV